MDWVSDSLGSWYLCVREEEEGSDSGQCGLRPRKEAGEENGYQARVGLKKDTGLEDLAQNDSTTTERLSYEGSSMCYRVVRYGPQPLWP
jgi:hypothetical protein